MSCTWCCVGHVLKIKAELAKLRGPVMSTAAAQIHSKGAGEGG